MRNPKFKDGQMVELVNGCKLIVVSVRKFCGKYIYALSYREDPDENEILYGFSEEVLK
jgi:hypothetical protein